MRQKYVETIQKYIDCVHAEAVTLAVEVVKDRNWFLPYFPINSNKVES